MAEPQKASGQTVTMFAPDGTTGEVPAESMRAAMQAGGKLAVWMKAPDGSIGMVPHDQVGAAQKSGGMVADPPQGYSTANSPKSTWQAFKETMPGTHDILHSLGLTREQMIEQNRYAGEHPWEVIGQVAFGENSPPGIAANILKSMAKEGGRGIKGSFSSDPMEQAMAGTHLASALNPFAAPVVDTMSEQGLGTPQANATGVVGAGTLAAGEVLPRVVPAAGRGAVKVAAPVTRAAVKVANKALSPAAVGGALASYGGPVGAAAGAGIMPELFPGWAAAAREGRIVPTPEWAAKSTPQMDLFRNTPKLGNAPSGTLSEMSAAPQANPLEVTNPALPQGEIQGPSTVPRVASGEAVLNQALTALDKPTLMRIAKSRGINTTQEANLMASKAEASLVKKIYADFSPEELDEVREVGLELSRDKAVPNPDISKEAAQEAWHYKVVKQFFPDVELPKAMVARAQKTIAQRPTIVRPRGILSDLGGQVDYEDILRQSIRQAQAARGK